MMTPFIVDVVVRSLLIAAGTGFVLWTFRIKTAAVRHAAWTAVVVAMLALPIWSIGGWKYALAVLPPVAPEIVHVGSSLNAVPGPQTNVETGPLTDAGATHESTPALTWSRVFIGAYVFGLFAMLVRLVVGTMHAHRLRGGATVVDGHLTSVRCTTPLTVGWFAPVFVLPADWTRWPASKLHVVLTHERAHARRHDPLVQWIALFNRAVFWWHPLAWWLERRLATLAEEACDAAVIAAGYSAEDYSDYLLDLARSVMRGGRRVHVAGMTMPGPGLATRMHRILDGLPAPASRARVTATVACCVLSTMMLAAVEPARQSSLRVPTFEVVSIKPCNTPEPPGAARTSTMPNGGLPPGLMHIECSPLVGKNGLIRRAYGTFASGTHNAFLYPTALPVEGGPAWASSDRYTIEAKAEGTPSLEMMHGPMLQAVLEDRFQLKLRRATRDVPVYDLTVAKSGSKLRPFDGSCKPVDYSKGSIIAQLEANGACPIVMRDTRIDGPGQTMSDFITFALSRLDRPVVDKTGLTGRFDIHVDLPADDARDQAELTSMLAIAIQRQLGLTLTLSKGFGDFLVIDHVQRPRPNDP